MSETQKIHNKRRCSTCVDEYGTESNQIIFHGHVVTKGRRPTFRCSKCGRKAFWNSGERVPSIWYWMLRRVQSD